MVVHVIVFAGGIFFWCRFSSCADCYLKTFFVINNWDIVLQPGVELHLSLFFPKSAIPRCFEVREWSLRISAGNSCWYE
jgi:hypothetical protein